MSDQTVGNVGRFFNHSAKPNLFMQCVHTGTCPGVDEPQHGKYDDRMPKLAFFAMKDIPAMTEVRPSLPSGPAACGLRLMALCVCVVAADVRLRQEPRRAAQAARQHRKVAAARSAHVRMERILKQTRHGSRIHTATGAPSSTNQEFIRGCAAATPNRSLHPA